MSESSKDLVYQHVLAIPLDKWQPVFSELMFEYKFSATTAKGSTVTLNIDYGGEMGNKSWHVYLDGEHVAGENENVDRGFNWLRHLPLRGLYQRLYRYHDVERRSRKHRENYDRTQRAKEEAEKLKKLKDRF